MKTTGNILTLRCIAVLAVCTLLFACQDDDVADNIHTKSICFGVSGRATGSKCTPVARNAAEERALQCLTLMDETKSDSLFMYATVCDGISMTKKTNAPAVGTRGIPVDDANPLEKFKVLAYWKTDGTLNGDFYMQDVISKSGVIWNGTNTYYWPGANHSLRFFGIAPSDADGLTIPVNSSTTKLSYIVPADAEKQSDLMLATHTSSSADGYLSGNYNSTVDLTFKHLCAQVRFVIGNYSQKTTITQITLSNIKDKGTYDIVNGDWTLDESSVTDYTLSLNKQLTGNESAGDAITTATQTLMMLPQNFTGSNASITVEFANGTSLKTNLAEYSDHQWKQGETITYSIIPVGPFEPANCYMIDATSDFNGIIRIPVIQARKGWQWFIDNSVSVDDATDALNNKLAYSNKENWEVTFQWIEGAKQSETSLTPTVIGSSEHPYLILNLSSLNPQNGKNALLSLNVGGLTYWSWHLWFTDYKPEPRKDGTYPADGEMKGQVHRFDGGGFGTGGLYEDSRRVMMDRNLGATITGITGAISPVANVENNKVTQTNHKNFYGLIYQFGRKDPFYGFAVDDKEQSSASNDSPVVSIRNPRTVYYGNFWSGQYKSWDLWYAETASSPSREKSPFDPCPPGWRVPSGGPAPYELDNPWWNFTESTHFTYKMKNHANHTDTGNWGADIYGGIYNYEGHIAWYPATGYFGGGYEWTNEGSNGSCWSATFDKTLTESGSEGVDGKGAYALFFSDENYDKPVAHEATHFRGNGRPVRCIRVSK